MNILPYGGLMTKPLEDEKLREQKLQEQQIEVEYDGRTQILRPEALFIRGVDSLSTDEISSYVDLYLNYTQKGDEYEALDPQIEYRVEWINDTAVVLVFQTHEAMVDALVKLSNEPIEVNSDLDNDAVVQTIIQERDAKPYAPVYAFRKHKTLVARLGLTPNEKMDEDDNAVELSIRQAFQADRKVKNAAMYSRYYLVHGEPERIKIEKKITREREPRRRDRKKRRGRDEGDLFAERLRGREEEEDLFADRLRERSPTR